MIDIQRFKTDIIALGLLAATVFLGLSLFSYDPADPPAQLVFPVRDVAQNLCGITGAHTAHFLRSGFGVFAWAILLALIVVDMRMFSRQKEVGVMVELFGLTLILTPLCIASQMMLGGNGATPLIGSGGYLGALGFSLMESQFSVAGSLILLASMFFAGLLLTADTLPVKILFACLTFPFRALSRESSEVDEEKEEYEEEEEEEEELVAEEEEEYEEEVVVPKAKKSKNENPSKSIRLPAFVWQGSRNPSSKKKTARISYPA